MGKQFLKRNCKIKIISCICVYLLHVERFYLFLFQSSFSDSLSFSSNPLSLSLSLSLSLPSLKPASREKVREKHSCPFLRLDVRSKKNGTNRKSSKSVVFEISSESLNGLIRNLFWPKLAPRRFRVRFFFGGTGKAAAARTSGPKCVASGARGGVSACWVSEQCACDVFIILVSRQFLVKKNELTIMWFFSRKQMNIGTKSKSWSFKKYFVKPHFPSCCLNGKKNWPHHLIKF